MDIYGYVGIMPRQWIITWKMVEHEMETGVIFGSIGIVRCWGVGFGVLGVQGYRVQNLQDLEFVGKRV